MIKRNLLKFGVVVMASACMVGCGSKATDNKPVETTTGVVAEVETTTTPVEVETTTEEPTTEEVTTEAPTEKPTEAPTQKPTEAPTQKPTEAPTQKPTEAPTQKPTEKPFEIIGEINPPTEAPITWQEIMEAHNIYWHNSWTNTKTYLMCSPLSDEEIKEAYNSVDWKEKAKGAAFARFGTSDGHTAESVKRNLEAWLYTDEEVAYAVAEWSKNPPVNAPDRRYNKALERLKTTALETTEGEMRWILYDYTLEEAEWAIAELRKIRQF